LAVEEVSEVLSGKQPLNAMKNESNIMARLQVEYNEKALFERVHVLNVCRASTLLPERTMLSSTTRLRGLDGGRWPRITRLSYQRASTITGATVA
jgi:hypothetical protein